MRVTLKLATSLDGRIAAATGESKWITGQAARAQGHRLRAEHDAVLVGVETVLADDPELTVRRPSPAGGEGVSRSDTEDGDLSARPKRGRPLRVVLDSRLRTPPTAKVVTGAALILTAAEPRPVGHAEVLRVNAEDDRPAVPAILEALTQRRVATLLIEGGGQVAASFLRAGAVDRIEWFRAPILLGGDGRASVATLELAKLADAPKFRRLSVEALGDDLWERYEAIR